MKTAWSGLTEDLDCIAGLEELETSDDVGLDDQSESKYIEKLTRTYRVDAFNQREPRLVDRGRELTRSRDDAVGRGEHGVVDSEVFRPVDLWSMLEASIVRSVQGWKIERFGLVDLLDLGDRFTDDGMKGA